MIFSRREEEQTQWVVGTTDKLWCAKRKRMLFSRREEEQTWWVRGKKNRRGGGNRQMGGGGRKEKWGCYSVREKKSQQTRRVVWVTDKLEGGIQRERIYRWHTNAGGKEKESSNETSCHRFNKYLIYSCLLFSIWYHISAPVCTSTSMLWAVGKSKRT